MKVLIIAKEDYLGAGKAAYRLYEAFKIKEIQTCLLVKNKSKINNEDIICYDDIINKSFRLRLIQFIRNRVLNIFEKKIDTDPNYYFFGSEEAKYNININAVTKSLPFKPDTIILTWTSQFFNSKSVLFLQKKLGAKVIAYPMDMSLFTGGCHYAWDCKGYELNCNNCPAITNLTKKNIAFNNLRKKVKYFDTEVLKPIAASESLELQMNSSVLFKNRKCISKILIPINESIFNSKFRPTAKATLGYNNYLKIIFFGSSFTDEKRKGLNEFILAINELHKIIINEGEAVSDYFVLIGGNKPVDIGLLTKLPLNYLFTGYIKEEKRLSMIYQAADVFVNTSLQDSGPMMINEAIMCGTPVVSFKVGVVNDLIIDGVTGYKADFGDVLLLGQHIFNVLKDNKTPDFNKKISEFGISKMGYANFPFKLFQS